MEAITFAECSQPGYAPRTFINAQADMTIAMAWRFDTAGEIATRRAVEANSKVYVPVPLPNSGMLCPVPTVRRTIIVVKDRWPKTINIAGNGIYSTDWTQEQVDEFVHTFLMEVFMAAGTGALSFKPELIRSGGQTGIDEAGLKAAVKLGIKAYCLAPRGWIFRGKDKRDIRSEVQFKARFEKI